MSDAALLLKSYSSIDLCYPFSLLIKIWAAEMYFFLTREKMLINSEQTWAFWWRIGRV
jgi:hypothetical protein